MQRPVQVYKEGNLTTEKLREAAVAWKDVFEEIPIHVRNSPLATALMASIEPDTVADTKDFERLQLGVRPQLEKNLEFLNDCLDDIVAEQQKVCHRHQHLIFFLFIIHISSSEQWLLCASWSRE